MIRMSNEAAMRESIEIAKLLCQNNGSGIAITRSGAKALADFIEELSDRLTGAKQKSDQPSS